jgi:hypothetical protein
MRQSQKLNLLLPLQKLKLLQPLQKLAVTKTSTAVTKAHAVTKAQNLINRPLQKLESPISLMYIYLVMSDYLNEVRYVLTFIFHLDTQIG